MSMVATIQQALANNLPQLGDLRRPVTVTREVTGTYDPQTQTHTAGADDGTSWEAPAIEDEFNRESMNGVTVQEGDVRLFVEVSLATFSPEPGMSATYLGKAWRIRQVRDHAQALYELHLGRAE